MSAQTTDRTRRATWVTAVALGLLALACAPSIAAPAATAIPAATPWPTFPPELDWPSEGEGTIALEVVNDLGRDICALYISPPADQTWGGNWLEDGDRWPDGESRRLNILPGHYDLMAEDCDGASLGEERNLDATADLTYTFTGGEPVVLAIYEDCPQPDITPANQIMILIGWMTTTLELAEQNANHIYFDVWVDEAYLGEIEPVRFRAKNTSSLEEFGCGSDEAQPMVTWHLPIGRLEPGEHSVIVEYLTDAEIDDGYDVYSIGSLGSLYRTFVVSEPDDAP